MTCRSNTRPFKMPSTTFDRHLRGNGWGMRRQRVLRCVRWCVLRRSRCRMRSAGCGSWTVWKVRARPTRSRLVEEVVALRSQAELMLARVDSPEVDQGRSAPVRLIRLRLCPSASPAGRAAMSGCQARGARVPCAGDEARSMPNLTLPPLSAWSPYCYGTDLLVPCMKVSISSRVRRPSLLASIPLKMRS